MDFLQQLLRATDSRSNCPRLFFPLPEVVFPGYYMYTLAFHRLPQTTTILFYFWSLWLFSVGLVLCLKQGEHTAYKAGVFGYCADS